MAHWLNYPGKRVGHDIAIECKSVDQFLGSYAAGMSGTIETGAMLGWRLLHHEMPDLKTLVVMRRPDEVLRSLALKGLFGPGIEEEIESRWHMLVGISQCKGVRSAQYEQLDDRDVRKEIFEWLLGIEFDEEWDERFAGVNIQIDFAARLAQLLKNQQSIAGFKSEIVSRQQKIGLSDCPIFN